MPIWHEKINLRSVWNHNDPWTEVRDAVVPILKGSEWYQQSGVVQDLVDELEDSETVEEFDCLWNYLYDEADMDRVWLATC